MSLRLTPLALVIGLATWGLPRPRACKSCTTRLGLMTRPTSARAPAQKQPAPASARRAALCPRWASTPRPQARTETPSNTNINARYPWPPACRASIRSTTPPTPLNLDRARRANVAAQSDLGSAEQDLMVRLSSAHFDVLAAQDALATARPKEVHLRATGLGHPSISRWVPPPSRTPAAQARYDIASAQEIAADNDLRVKRTALDPGRPRRRQAQAAGHAGGAACAGLRPHRHPGWPPPRSSTRHPQSTRVLRSLSWTPRSRGLARSPRSMRPLASARKTCTTTSPAWCRVLGRGRPRMPASASQLHPTHSSPAATPRAASGNPDPEERARNDLEFARRSVAQATRQTFSFSQSLRAQAQALEAAESSSKLALEATQLGYKVGVRVNLDVLNARPSSSAPSATRPSALRQHRHGPQAAPGLGPWLRRGHLCRSGPAGQSKAAPRPAPLRRAFHARARRRIAPMLLLLSPAKSPRLRRPCRPLAGELLASGSSAGPAGSRVATREDGAEIQALMDLSEPWPSSMPGATPLAPAASRPE